MPPTNTGVCTSISHVDKDWRQESYMNTFKSSAELKASAKERMFGHYGTAVGAVLITLCIVGFLDFITFLFVDTTTVVGTVFYYVISFLLSLLSGLFTSGTTYLYLEIICGRPASVGDIFRGFSICPNKAILIQGFISLISYIANIPMIIISYKVIFASQSELMRLMLPYSLSIILSGVVSMILSLLYAQAFYLLHDFPQYSVRELLAKSRKLMVGHKGRLFYIYVSFLPLLLVAMLSCGIGLLWLIPYMNATQTEFFLDLIQNKNN